MEPKVIFQRLVQRDMDDVLRCYTDEAGELVADRFFQTFLQIVERTARNWRSIVRSHRSFAASEFPGFRFTSYIG